jgi:putative autotransporter adhesin-like protein
MKRLIFLIPVFALSICFAQKTINDPNAEKREVPTFNAIEVSGGIDLYLSPGPEAVVVSASETKYRDRIRTVVEKGVLKIYYNYNSVFSVGGARHMKAYVSFKQLDILSASGGSDIHVDGSIDTKKLILGLSGGSDFSGRINTTDFVVEMSGGSDVKISGKTSTADINSSGGSDFKGYDLSSETCKISTSGGSDVYVTVTKKLTAKASGGSDVYYKGTADVDMAKSGGGSIKKADN